jgi:hypothetical protein
MSASRLALLALSCFALLACGGDDDEKSAVEKCDDLVADICARAVECVDAVSEEECIADVGTVISCGQADAVSSSYGRCIDQVDRNSCDSLFPVNPESGQPELALPADCEAVILFE